MLLFKGSKCVNKRTKQVSQGTGEGSGSNAGTDMGTLSLAQWLIYKI